MFSFVKDRRTEEPLMKPLMRDLERGAAFYDAGLLGRGGARLFVLHAEDLWIPVEPAPFETISGTSSPAMIRRGLQIGPTPDSTYELKPLVLYHPNGKDLEHFALMMIEALLTNGIGGDGLEVANSHYQIEYDGHIYTISDFRP